MNSTVGIKVSNEFVKLLEKIMEQEKVRGNNNPSYRLAGDILLKRINDAGGLRE